MNADPETIQAAQLAGVDLPRNKFVIGTPLADVPRLGDNLNEAEAARMRNGYNLQLFNELKDLKELFQEKRQQKIVSESLGDNQKRRTLIADLAHSFGAEPLVTVND